VEAKQYRLVDVVARSRRHKLTFHVPSEEERTSLRPKDAAKLVFDDRERLWVEVCEAAGGRYRGVMLGRPAVLLAVRKGDIVDFGPEHVADVVRREDFKIVEFSDRHSRRRR
jgi:hypothetical protein